LLRSPIPLLGKSVYVVFVHAASLIGSRDTVEEYLAYRMFPLSTSFFFGEIADWGGGGGTPVSKVTLPLPEFPLAKFQGESDDHFWVRVELWPRSRAWH
jgi:hypothetical protein